MPPHHGHAGLCACCGLWAQEPLPRVSQPLGDICQACRPLKACGLQRALPRGTVCPSTWTLSESRWEAKNRGISVGQGWRGARFPWQRLGLALIHPGCSWVGGPGHNSSSRPTRPGWACRIPSPPAQSAPGQGALRPVNGDPAERRRPWSQSLWGPSLRAWPPWSARTQAGLVPACSQAGGPAVGVPVWQDETGRGQLSRLAGIGAPGPGLCQADE